MPKYEEIVKGTTVSFWVILILFTTTIYSFNKTLYVDNFNSVLGNPTKEDNLLKFAQNHNFSTLILYELNKVDKRLALKNKLKNKVLADFISRARVTFGITNIGASGESTTFFKDIIAAYNNSRNKKYEKINIYNLEFEYWSKKASSDGGYYCEGYLRDFNKPCNRQGSFEFYLDNLKELKLLANSESEIEIKTETYLNSYTSKEIIEINKYSDRLILLAYGKSPDDCFKATLSNLIKLKNINSQRRISILFFTKMNQMGYWLRSNSISNSENRFKNILNTKNEGLKNLNVGGFSYHTYSYLRKAVSYYSYRQN